MAESDVGAVDVGDRTVSSSKVSLAALTALGIGSMIGGGIFGLPQQMARAAAPGPLIIGWFITGVGMLMLAFVYQRLAISRPEINAGVYGYARAGFGDLVGFSSAWGTGCRPGSVTLAISCCSWPHWECSSPGSVTAIPRLPSGSPRSSCGCITS